MNAQKVSKFGIGLSLTMTALLLGSAPVFTTSCAGGDGGSAGGGGGQGGGGQGGGGQGGGGTGGGSTVPTDCPADPGSASSANFCNGKAQGALQGYGYIALGLQNTATSPLCAEDPTNLSVTRQITSPPKGECEADGKTCPRTGQTVWNAPDGLCITGTIPKVQNSDYDSDWGLQVGVNTSDPPADTSGNGKTLGQILSNASSLTTIALTTTGEITPANSAVRIEIHLVDQTCTEYSYCATMSASDKPVVLTSFNTNCWAGSTCGSTPICKPGDDTTKCCKQLQASDLSKIDKIGIQISSDTSKDYAINNYCLKGITFAE